ncbi:MAG: hypothetical protein QHH07_10505, partial [Sedimentisphaerales bacterium]|nr:hypothetical protein [Sedimentisphaerales bacterium]
HQIHELARSGIDYRMIYQATGCEHCYGTGYYGRIAVVDLLLIDDQLRNGIAHNTAALVDQLRRQGDQKGRSNLHKQGLRKVVEGITTLEEIKRVLG